MHQTKRHLYTLVLKGETHFLVGSRGRCWWQRARFTVPVSSPRAGHIPQLTWGAGPGGPFLSRKAPRANCQVGRTPVGSLQSSNFLLLLFDFLHPSN